MSKIKWSELQISAPISQALSKLPFQELTEIQALSIPEALKGRDLVALAQTGSGKTLAYAIPALEHVQKKQSQVLILAPTRELAEQIHDVFQQIRPSSQLRVALLVGGSSMLPQLRNLKSRPQIVVGTPGRVLDHVRRKTLLLSQVDFFVLDECDRMLDMGFAPQIEDVMQGLPEKRQTLLFSATLPPAIEKSFSKKMQSPLRIGAEVRAEAPTQIVQRAIQTKQGEKIDRLIDELVQKKGSTIIFARTKSRTDKLAKHLIESGYKTSRLHGDRSQKQRREAIENFRSGRSDILVATDIAARGLDIPHVKLVVNFDLPQTAEDFVHRIGRTGRAGAAGESISFITSEDQGLWRQIERLINKKESSTLAPAARSSTPQSTRRPSQSPAHQRRPSYSKPSDARREELPRKRFSRDEEAPRWEARAADRQEGRQEGREKSRSKHRDSGTSRREFGDSRNDLGNERGSFGRPRREFGIDRAGFGRARREDGSDRGARKSSGRQWSSGKSREDSETPRSTNSWKPRNPFKSAARKTGSRPWGFSRA